jgi:hypothetical protein
LRYWGLNGCAAILAAGCWLAACACSPPLPEAGTRSVAVSPATASVSLERGPCFGTCPVYTVSIDRSGGVRFDGRRFVVDTGVSLDSVPPVRVDSLIAELEAAGYFDFADSYRMGQPACEPYATDLPVVITEVRLGPRTKRVEHDRGCSGAPKSLTALEGRIDEVAGVRKWIGR